MVSIRLYPERDRHRRPRAVVASMAACFDRDPGRYDWQHYMPLIERKPGALRNGAPFADMPEPLLRLRGLLLARGRRPVMARCWRPSPTHGLDAVLVAVELVLESGGPSAEHVENVLTGSRRTATANHRDRPARGRPHRWRRPIVTTACARR
jgi:hypothetical protein